MKQWHLYISFLVEIQHIEYFFCSKKWYLIVRQRGWISLSDERYVHPKREKNKHPRLRISTDGVSDPRCIPGRCVGRKGGGAGGSGSGRRRWLAGRRKVVPSQRLWAAVREFCW